MGGHRAALSLARGGTAPDGRLGVRAILLWGLLADGASESVAILRRGNVDIRRLWTDLRRWHRSA